MIKKYIYFSMENCKSVVIFEKTLEAPHSSQPFILRMVKQQYPDRVNYILERFDKNDAMGSPIWLEVSSNETYLALETMGEFFSDLNIVDFQSIESTVKKNKRLKNLLEIVIAFHHKEGTSIDFNVTGQGERFIKKISNELFDDYYPEDEILDELVKKHQKLI